MNTAIRISPPLLARIDAFAVRLQAELPGAMVTRSEAIRILLTKALDSVAPLAPAPPASGSKP